MAKRFNEDFKKTIVELNKSGKSIADLSREYGISRITIYNWLDKKKEIQVNDEPISKEEIIKLRKKICELGEENDILKKATAIFAKRR